MSQIKEWFDLLPAKNIAMLVDSCFAGLSGVTPEIPGDLYGGAKAGKGVVRISNTPDPIIRPITGNIRRVILAAGRANQPAMEGPEWGHGIFTYYALEGLGGKADLDRDGVVNALELYHYVYPRVYSSTEGRQTPQLFGWGEASVPISRPPAAPVD